MQIIIGIDTGGTYTDAVICDAKTHEIYSSAKALTTHDDLTRGITNVLGKLDRKYFEDVKMVSLSTTLATNACVENKGCHAFLVLFGTETKTMASYGSVLGQISMDDVWCIETNTHGDGYIENMPDWDEFEKTIREKYNDYDAYAVAEIYSKQTGSVLEKKASEIIRRVTAKNVVCGYELFNELNVLKRGVNAMLNARLVPVIEEFLVAIDESLEKFGIDAPAMIVRSDGTLMASEFAKDHPIETLLCGPAASALGACSLVGMDRALIADIGGTTSDIAFIDSKRPEQVDGTVRIGGWQTFLHGLFIETFGLGGDSGVTYLMQNLLVSTDSKPLSSRLKLGTTRFIPLCVIASHYPEVAAELKDLKNQKRNNSVFFEYIALQGQIKNPKEYSDEELRVVELLKQRPYTVPQITELIQRKHYFSPEHLLNTGVVIKCGITPTDIMHVKGDFVNFDVEASKAALEFAARSLNCEVEDICDDIYDKAKFRLYKNLCNILLNKDFPRVRTGYLNAQIFDEFVERSWRGENEKGNLIYSFTTNDTVVGLGGPAAVFIPDVAEKLGTNCVIPEYASVANALGACLGIVSFNTEVIVKFDYLTGKKEMNNRAEAEAVSGFLVMARGMTKFFDVSQREEAMKFARKTAVDQALSEATLRGIHTEPIIEIEEKSEYVLDPNMPSQVKVIVTCHN